MSSELEGKKDYEEGLRDGKIRSLEKVVSELTTDMNRLKLAIYALYGAIALVQILPELRGVLTGV